jgi:DNA-3-methyladenine glycosylase II
LSQWDTGTWRQGGVAASQQRERRRKIRGGRPVRSGDTDAKIVGARKRSSVFEARTDPSAGSIEGTLDLQEGVRVLRRTCAIMQRVHDTTGDPPLRREVEGIPGLARIVVGQQLSTASASAIWQRLVETVVPLSAGQILATRAEALREVGLSNAKIKTLRALAEAVAAGRLDLDALRGVSDERVHAALTGVRGIGPWSADLYLMFCLGRRDAFAAGDLALQVAAAHALSLATRPAPSELFAIAERWRPWRGVAARLLWAYYRVIRDGRSGAPV